MRLILSVFAIGTAMIFVGWWQRRQSKTAPQTLLDEFRRLQLAGALRMVEDRKQAQIAYCRQKADDGNTSANFVGTLDESTIQFLETQNLKVELIPGIIQGEFNTRVSWN